MENKKIYVLVGYIYPNKPQIYKLLKKIGVRGVKCVFMSSFSRIKKVFSYDNYTGDKIDAIFVGQVPHKTHGTISGSLLSEISIAEAKVPVYACKTKSGQLKGTKTALKDAFETHKERSDRNSENINLQDTSEN
ncbi:hypothetical protein K9M48_04175 [Candidatus Gracilibacteria bacterium]|nr:hypothetical protein [Candidatus Gracilibacteria bacterium]